ncbi:hypothetical protein [Muricoccus nepalensis]|uniref:hypothetical protein n=1 Tax=Muricoccus nepalensis TaxID=1854500 RepID=UPI0019D590A4|nr:hypothetical protein [Roseomonas nepalensis]
MSEGRRLRFTVPPEHPCLPGHFPGRPVVPGVVLLDRVMAAAGMAGAGRLPSAKFLRPVLPGEEVLVELRPLEGGRLAFTAHVGAELAFRGEVAPP